MSAAGTVLESEEEAVREEDREEVAAKGQDFVIRSLNEIEDP